MFSLFLIGTSCTKDTNKPLTKDPSFSADSQQYSASVLSVKFEQKKNEYFDNQDQEARQQITQRFSREHRSEKSASRSGGLLEFDEALAAIEVAINYDFRFDLSDSIKFDTIYTYTESIQRDTTDTNAVLESAVDAAIDAFFTDIQSTVDISNGIVQLVAYPEISSISSSSIGITLTSFLYESVTSMNSTYPYLFKIESSEYLYAAASAGGCNGYTAVPPMVDAARRAWPMAHRFTGVSCSNGNTGAWYSLKRYDTRATAGPAFSCANGNYFIGNYATCQNSTTMSAQLADLENIKACCLTDANSGSATRYFADIIWHGNINNGPPVFIHSGFLFYGALDCSTSGNGVGY